MGLWDSFNTYTGGLYDGSLATGVFDSMTGKTQSDAIKSANEVSQANADKNIALQREFAQHGIRWKIEDAKAAGIHPLAALGASTASFSPVSVGTMPDTARADAMGAMGQNLTRAISSTRTQDERTMAQLNVQGAQLDVEGKALDNQIKTTQLGQMRATGPAFPGSGNFISGQGNSGSPVTEKPLERTASLPGSPHAEPGAVPEVGWLKTSTGVVPVPSNDAKQRIEDNEPHEFMHFYRNNVRPNFGGGTSPPDSALPKGATHWEWSYSGQEYRPAFDGGNRTGKPDRPGYDWNGSKNRKQTDIRNYR